jgi:hypothetical protein
MARPIIATPPGQIDYLGRHALRLARPTVAAAAKRLHNLTLFEADGPGGTARISVFSRARNGFA